MHLISEPTWQILMQHTTPKKGAGAEQWLSSWMNQPNPHLGGVAPVSIVGQRYALDRLVTALEKTLG